MSLKEGTIVTVSDMSVPSPPYSPYGHLSPTGKSAQKVRLPEPKSLSDRFVDSFRMHPTLCEREKSSFRNSSGSYDVEVAHSNLADSPLARKLKGRHLQMIAIGGSIGTGLFVGSGHALAIGGPGALVVSFTLIGMMLYCTVHALGELAILFPVAGSFASYCSRFMDPAWGFAMGYAYSFQWLIVLPLEVVAATLTLDYWHSSIPTAVWVTIFWFLIFSLNMIGVKGYGEAEFVFSIIKVTAVVSFIILGIILNISGGPSGSYLGGTYWHIPGAFANGFKGVCDVFVMAAFAFSGTELVGMAAAETSNPRKSLPTAVKQVFWRITLFYIVSLALIGILVPYTDKRLMGGTSGSDARASPFVISILNAGITILPDIMNIVIMISVLSVGNSAVFGASRTLVALAEQGQAPKILGYIDRSGRPTVGIAVSAGFGLLSYLGAASSKVQDAAFTWMLAISGLASIFVWGSICICHIRFRKAWKLHGHSIKELAFVSQAGVIGSWAGLALNVMVIATQFWTSLFPIGQKTSVLNFLSTYLCVPVVMVLYLGYKIWYKTKWVRLEEFDLVSGRRELDLAALLADERAERASWPAWKRVYKFFC